MESADNPCEVVSNRVEAEIFDSPLGDDHDVDGLLEEVGLRTVRLTNPSLDTVSVDGAADLAGHRDAEPTAARPTRSDVNNELSAP
jgi:hypothetical protein